jgi:hypothetical protein
MSTMRIQSDPGQLAVEATRERQTAVPSSPFRDVLAGSASVLLSGAAVATSVLGGPVLAAAVRGAAAGVAPGAAVGVRSSAVAGVSPDATAAALGGAAAGELGGGSEMATMHAMQRESQTFNLQLLALQEEVQQENRHFTTVSNVMRAKHDTAKAAVGNIRA